MRFCQTDGTVLIEDAPADPYKTVVGNQSDIASAIPPLDPFKTMVASPPPKAAEEDILQLPEEPDQLKTMVVTPEELREQLKAGGAAEEVPPLDLQPPAPLAPSAPLIEPKPAAAPTDFSSPPPPKPSGAISSDATAIQESPPSPFDSKPFQNDFSSQSPYGNKENKPIPSPFNDSLPPGYQPPSASPFDAPKPPMVKEVEPSFGGFEEPANPSPFEPPSPFGQPESLDAPIQSTAWTPPPAPVSGWGNQELGANTPFQPPVAGAGQNQTLSIISLVLGGIGLITIIPTLVFTLCGILPIAFGLGAIITGFLARSRAKQKPDEYTGGGLALGGLIAGAISLLVPIVIIVITLLFVFGMLSFATFSK